MSEEKWNKVHPVGMSGTMDNGLSFNLFVPGPFSCEEEREETLQLIDLFKRAVTRIKVVPKDTQ